MGHHKSCWQRSCPKHEVFLCSFCTFCRFYKLNMKFNRKSNIDVRFKEAFEIFIFFFSFVFIVILFLCFIRLRTQSSGKLSHSCMRSVHLTFVTLISNHFLITYIRIPFYLWEKKNDIWTGFENAPDLLFATLPRSMAILCIVKLSNYLKFCTMIVWYLE